MTHTLRVGSRVHVDDRADDRCYPGTVIDPADHSGSVARIRVIRPSRVIGAIGDDDAEAWYPHRTDRQQYTNPDGSTRWGDSWHLLAECDPDHSPID